MDRLLEGDRVVLVTDAGMPSVSDPGYRLVSAAIRVGVTVTCVPGPSAVLMALAVSGMPVDRFCFEGFLPRKPGERTRALAELREERADHGVLRGAAPTGRDARGDGRGVRPRPRAAVCRELTKTYEEVRRGTLVELTAWAEEHARGEITVVVAGLRGAATEVADVVPTIQERVAAGERLKDVCADLALQTGLSKKALYDAALAAR